MGNHTSQPKKPTLSPMDRELALRRRLLLQRNHREQQQWRERRLRDVVIVLLERGEVLEGISLAFQLPAADEVPARRPVRIPRGTAMSDNARRRLRQTLAVLEEDENLRYDADALKTIRAPLPELLAEGRPADCLPAPDVMQLLLEGKEFSLSDEDDEDMTSVTEAEDTDEDDERSTATRDGPLSSRASSFAGRGAVHPDECPIDRGSVRSSSKAGSSVSMRSGRTSPTMTNADDYPIDRGSFGGAGRSGRTSRTGSFANSSAFATPMSVSLDMETPTERSEREARHKKHEAIIRELHYELHIKKKRFRRRTAEEVYGSASAYAANAANRSSAEDGMVGRPLTAVMMMELSTSHRIADVLSPLSPFQYKGGKRDHNNNSGSSHHNGNSSSSMNRRSHHKSAFPTSDGDSDGDGDGDTKKVPLNATSGNYVNENSDCEEEEVKEEVKVEDQNHINSSARSKKKNNSSETKNYKINTNESVEPLVERN